LFLKTQTKPKPGKPEKPSQTGLNRFFPKKPKPGQTDWFRFGFLGIKPVQTGLTRFFPVLARFFRFGLIFFGFGSVFSVFAYKTETEPNRLVFLKF
jgi:hypothetical protein